MSKLFNNWKHTSGDSFANGFSAAHSPIVATEFQNNSMFVYSWAGITEWDFRLLFVCFLDVLSHLW